MLPNLLCFLGHFCPVARPLFLFWVSGSASGLSETSGDPSPQYFLKSVAVRMGVVLPYEWEAYCSTNWRCIVGLFFLHWIFKAWKPRRYSNTAIQIGGVLLHFLRDSETSIRALKVTELRCRESPKRRFSQKTADFRRFTPSPGNSSIWTAQETAANRRFSQKTEDFRRKPQETADWAPSP